MNNLKTSSKGISLIKMFESLHDGDLSFIGLQPKMCPAGIWTEGWGNAIVDPDTGKFLKGAENKEKAYRLSVVKDGDDANEQLERNLRKFEAIVKKNVKVDLNQNQFDALVSHTYNTGGSSTLFRLVNEGADQNKIYSWFTTRYIKGGGVVLKGLVRRRKAEADLYFRSV